MSDIKPYSLTPGSRNSDAYYTAIAAFTDAWLAQARAALARPVGSFLDYRTAHAPEGYPRTFDECAFEMLALGVVLREHGEQALQMDAIPAAVLGWLVETQDRLPLPAIETPVKAMRGLLQGLSQGEELSGASPDTLPFAGGAAPLVGRLVDWLQAEGFKAQSERLDEWRGYLAQIDEQSGQAILARCLLLAESFAEESQAALSEFTANTASFAREMEDCARWRYDAGLITRQPVEYHLAMLGTEILSRAYRESFKAQPRKIVIMPDCLCAHSRRSDDPSAQTCQAVRTELGGKCQGCTPKCKVNQITRLGERSGFEAYILPDNARGVGLGACSKLSGVGVVGISCLLTNWDAGWQINAAGVPAQGVLLDYAGCKSHWDDSGVTTDVNLGKLLETIRG